MCFRQLPPSGYYQLLEIISAPWAFCILVRLGWGSFDFLWLFCFFYLGVTKCMCLCVEWYQGFVCLETLPALYERYEEQVDEIAGKGNRNVKKLYEKFDSKVLNKIPRGPVKEKKFRWIHSKMVSSCGCKFVRENLMLIICMIWSMWDVRFSYLQDQSFLVDVLIK